MISRNGRNRVGQRRSLKKIGMGNKCPRIIIRKLVRIQVQNHSYFEGYFPGRHCD